MCLQLLELYDDKDMALCCDIPDRAAAAKSIAQLAGSQPVETQSSGLKPSPVVVSAVESEIVCVSSSTTKSPSLAPISSYDNLFAASGDAAKVKTVTVTVMAGSSSAVKAPLDSVLGPRSRSLSNDPITSTPQHLPPPADTPAADYSSDYSTFSEANQHRSAAMDTPSNLPPPMETPPPSWPCTPSGVVAEAGHSAVFTKEELCGAFANSDDSSKGTKRSRLE